MRYIEGQFKRQVNKTLYSPAMSHDIIVIKDFFQVIITVIMMSTSKTLFVQVIFQFLFRTI
jgi:hypothetical protein